MRAAAPNNKKKYTAMTLTPRHLLLALAASGLAGPACAAFIEDSKAQLELTNFYFNRDFRDPGAAQSKADEWAQGLALKIESGYTEGPVGFGLDALGLLGVKLDSSPDRTGTGILKSDREAPFRAQDEYGELGLTGKLRVSRTTVHGGTLQPLLPVLMRNYSRLLPQTFRGAWLNSREWDGLTLDAGWLGAVNQRNSSDYEDMTVFNGGARNIVLGQAASDRFLFGGGSYQWTPALTTSYYAAELQDLYREHNLRLLHVLPLGEQQSLKTDLRYLRSTDAGNSNIDAHTFAAILSYRLRHHTFSASYQQLDGDTGYAYIAGSDNFLPHLSQVQDFGNEDERSWQLRYDYDFAGLGLPGLSFMTRYTKGSNIQLQNDNGNEWERNTDIAYVAQDGPFKGLGIKLRNATVRSDFGSDIDENRLILSYSLQLR